MVFESAKPDTGQPIFGFLFLLFRWQTFDIKRHRGVLQHRPMREKREFLEHHRHFVLAHLPQIGCREVHDINPIHQNLAIGGFDETVEVADQGGLARA